MADDIFTFPVSARPTGQVAHRVLSMGMGDGYVQMGADGIHARSQAWQISMTGSILPGCSGEASKIQGAADFIDAHKGYMSFLWKPPGQEAARFVSAGYSWLPMGNNVFTLSTTFQQVFFP